MIDDTKRTFRTMIRMNTVAMAIMRIFVFMMVPFCRHLADCLYGKHMSQALNCQQCVVVFLRKNYVKGQNVSRIDMHSDGMCDENVLISDGDGMARLNIEIKEAVHKRFLNQCEDDGRSVTDVVRELILSFTERRVREKQRLLEQQGEDNERS